MNKYSELPQEQKESINPKLRKLFEGIENALTFPEVNMYCYHIEGFQEGLKTAIKIIDEEIDNLEDLGLVKIKEQEPIEFETIYNNDTFNLVNNRIEELKKQREQLQFEVELK